MLTKLAHSSADKLFDLSDAITRTAIVIARITLVPVVKADHQARVLLRSLTAGLYITATQRELAHAFIDVIEASIKGKSVEKQEARIQLAFDKLRDSLLVFVDLADETISKEANQTTMIIEEAHN